MYSPISFPIFPYLLYRLDHLPPVLSGHLQNYVYMYMFSDDRLVSETRSENTFSVLFSCVHLHVSAHFSRVQGHFHVTFQAIGCGVNESYCHKQIVQKGSLNLNLTLRTAAGLP